MAVVGQMSGAYFVGKRELLGKVNELLNLNFSKVEDMANGAAYCQILDALLPGKVPMHKVNFGAKLEWEMLKNYKVLQEVLQKNGISRLIPVDRLVKGRAQDNLELLQWLMALADLHAPKGDYAPVERRKGSSGTSALTAVGSSAGGSGPTAASRGVVKTRPRPRPAAQPAPTKAEIPTTAVAPQPVPKAASGKTQQLEAQIAEHKAAEDGFIKERDFYFGKLRDIEIYLQTDLQEGNLPTLSQDAGAIVARIFQIMYAEEEENA